MVDIARVFSPVVVFASGEARPQSSDRIRSASTKRISSASTRRTSRVSSAVSTVESSDSGNQVRYITNEINDEKDLEAELKEELTTPLTGINLLELINDKISKLDRALRSVEAPSDAHKNQALITSEKLRIDAVQNGQSRQQVQQFAGLLAIKSTFQDQISTAIKSKENTGVLSDQDQSTLLEIFQYPGFHEDHVSPLPFNVSLEMQIMRHILSKRYTPLARQAPHIKSLIELYYSTPTKALILDIFWWVFLENYQNQPKIQKKLLERASNSYVSLLMMEIDLRYRDKCFQVYPSLLAETVFACFKVCFPASIKQMPADAEAAGKTKNENKNPLLDLGNISDTPGQRMKELVNLDSFKNSISNICQLWLSGLPAPPRRYEQWRSKIVQREKISFHDSTLTPGSITDHPTTTKSAPHSLLTMQSTSRSSIVNGTKTGTNESVLASSHYVTFKRNKRKEPHELLEEIYKHTDDPLPDRRVLFEDYRFDLNGNSPLTEKFLRSRHMLRKSGTQLFITHPQISQVPLVSAETFDNEIKRAARICRVVRAQKHKEQAAEEAQRHRQIARQRAATSKTRDELEKQEEKASIYRRRIMIPRNDEFESISQLSFKFHQ